MDSLLSDHPLILTRPEIAELLRVSDDTLSRWAKRGIGPRCVYLTEGTPRYMKGDVLDYLKGL